MSYDRTSYVECAQELLDLVFVHIAPIRVRSLNATHSSYNMLWFLAVHPNTTIYPRRNVQRELRAEEGKEEVVAAQEAEIS